MLLRRLYTWLFYLSLPAILLRLLWRARKNSAYKHRWNERLGFFTYKSPQKTIWLHAVSVGEALAAVPIIKALQQKYPAIPLIITTTTPTGADRIKAIFDNQIVLVYLPYDLPSAIRRFLKAMQPQLGIIIETELWPNLLHECAQAKVPIFLANARLSARSAKGYGRLGPIAREMMQNITQMAVQTQTEAERFKALGLTENKIQVTGSIKFDLQIPDDLLAKAKILRAEWGTNRSIWIAASTHETEEEQILESFNKILKKIPELLLVLVPRHPERFEKVANLVKKQNYNFISRSENKTCEPTTQVIVGDTMGELLLFFAAGDIAFIGGSFVNTGGHNPLEPAALGLPILMGPSYFNFAMIGEQLQQVNALIIINSPDQLADEVLQILKNKNKQYQMGQNARQYVDQNKGALNKHLALIDNLLEK